MSFAAPPPYPPPYRTRPRRRFRTAVAWAAAGAAVAALTTALIVHGVDSETTRATATTVTVTASASPSLTPTPLPTAEADRQTCNAWLAAGDKIHAASHALSVIPNGSTIRDPQVRDNPELSGAAREAAKQYGLASDALAAGIAPGTTAILEQSARAASASLHALSTADATLDAASGNTYHVVRESADTMDVLCNRLAPR